MPYSMSSGGAATTTARSQSSGIAIIGIFAASFFFLARPPPPPCSRARPLGNFLTTAETSFPPPAWTLPGGRRRVGSRIAMCRSLEDCPVPAGLGMFRARPTPIRLLFAGAPAGRMLTLDRTEGQLRGLLLENIPPDAAARLAKDGYHVETTARALDEDELIAAVGAVDLLGIRSGTPA